jgi:hypothetical protein
MYFGRKILPSLAEQIVGHYCENPNSYTAAH